MPPTGCELRRGAAVFLELEGTWLLPLGMGVASLWDTAETWVMPLTGCELGRRAAALLELEETWILPLTSWELGMGAIALCNPAETWVLLLTGCELGRGTAAFLEVWLTDCMGIAVVSACTKVWG